MNKEEFSAIYNYVFAEEKEPPTSQVKTVWWDQFAKLEKEEFFQAARELKRRKHYGAPRVSDMWTVLKEARHKDLPPSLRMTPVEALANSSSKKLLIADARNFADRAVPPIDPFRQFESPEDLDKAQRIHQATWEREFKSRFERRQQEALALVEKGMDPRDAIKELSGYSAVLRLDAPGRAVLNRVMGELPQ